ncbi:MAG TPA: 3-deoxy-manno-octulosonate cytidylyltransferase, partial [Bacteroidales bacterium]|nr:3-deoxy-manno-octulosonate cytidylyltransferase [Bacteroidales bacterium]
MNIIGIIPARYNSSRFPGKPLVKINGISMIERVYNQATKTKFLKKVIVATDDERISTHVTNFGGIAIMTSTNVKNGTERCYIALKILQELSPNLNYDVIINIQGDEPFIQPSEIDTLAKCFIDDNNTQIATLIKEISNEKDLFNPSIIKVITDINNFAIYFSRSP